MGWWSTDIMGGDSPLDFEDEIFDICNVNKFPEGGGMAKLTKEDLQPHLEEIIAMIEKSRSEKVIGYQVLAVLTMGAGCPVDESLKAKMVEACHLDDWSHENEEREIAVGGLLKALEAYDGKTPIKIKSRGLFEVMAEKLGNNEDTIS
jgi:hypothetical protein